MFKIYKLIILMVLPVLVANAHAFNSPVSFNIAPPVEFPQPEFSVTGLRVSALWGHQRDMFGIDLAAGGNITDLEFVGIAISGLFNITNGTTTAIGLQAAGLTNVNTKTANIYGVQLAGILNDNIGSSSVNGLQIALINKADHTIIRGAQLGLYNKAQEVYGFQIGLINVVDTLHGLQIGLANFNYKGLFVVSPVLNVGW